MFLESQPLTDCLLVSPFLISTDVYFNNKMHGKGLLTMLNQYTVSNILLI